MTDKLDLSVYTPQDLRDFLASEDRKRVRSMEKVKLHERRITMVKKEMEDREFPTEPPEGTLVKFRVQYNTSGTIYVYAAVHERSRWYLTAKMDSMSWRDIVSMVRRSKAADKKIMVYDNGGLRGWLDVTERP
jgi:hypothetical protein